MSNKFSKATISAVLSVCMFAGVGCSAVEPNDNTSMEKDSFVFYNVKEEDGTYMPSKSSAYVKTKGNAFENSVLEMELKLTGGSAEVCFGARSQNDGYIAAYENGAISVYSVNDGDKVLLGTKSARLDNDKWYSFRIENDGGDARVYFSDENDPSPLWADFTVNTDGRGNEYVIDMENINVKKLSLKEHELTVTENESVYVNPVEYASQPTVTYYKGVYYMYAQSERGTGLDSYRSYDMIDWNNNGMAVSDSDMPTNPAATPANGKMLLAYNLGGKVYLAESEDPQKGFVGWQIGIAGEVSSLFADGEDIYLLYTQDKDLYGALLTKDGGTYSVGEKVKLVGASSGALHRNGDKYYLFYTVESDSGERMEYASSETALGSYAGRRLLIGTGERSLGVTEPSVTLSPDGKEAMLAYQIKDNDGIHIDRLAFGTDSVSTTAPAAGAQAVPSGVTRIMMVGDMSADERTRKNDLMFAINLAAQNVSGTLNFDNNYFPHWNADITRNGTTKYLDGWHGHNIGRWMDAMYRWQDLTGEEIDPFLKNVMLNNTKWFFSNEEGLCLQPEVEGIGKFFDLHSLREGMAALNAIIKYETGEWRDWAHGAAEKMIATLDGALDENLHWDFSKFPYYQPGVAHLNNYFDACGSTGRFNEALMQYYFITENDSEIGASAGAMKLAAKIVNYNYTVTTTPDGDVNKAGDWITDSGIGYSMAPNHTHSFLNSLQAMLHYGRATGERKYIERVELVFRNTVLGRLISESGVINHDLESGAQGWETSSSTDVLQLSMWLAEEGYTQYWSVAERILRARLLPAQFVEGDKLIYEGGSAAAGWNMANRVNGGYSMIFDSPYSGKFCTTDVTCHVMQGIIDAQRRILSETNGAAYVRMHFDAENESVKTRSERGETGVYTVEMKADKDLYISLFAFTDEVTLKVNGKARELVADGDFAAITGLKKGDVVEMEYELTEKTTQEHHTDNKTYTLKWKGDEIISVSPYSNFFPMFKK